jgi:aryl-alcohol dehydrogenase-like predicted oxidoreductase
MNPLIETVALPNIKTPPSRIGLGTWAIGGWMWGGTEEGAAIRTIRTALESGISLIDTAPVYGFGASERIVGKALSEHGHRDSVILATKVALEWDERHKVQRNAGRARITQEINDSLRRLNTDYIDIYQVHWPDAGTPVEETATTMAELLESGKIRAIGVSNYSPETMAEFRRYAPIHTSQPPYNLFERQLDAGSLEFCRANGIALITYGALCRGLLSGAVTAESTFVGDDLRRSDPKFRKPRFSQYLAAVEQLDRFAGENYQKRVIHLAARWILDRGIEVALWGARSPEQLAPILQLSGWSLDETAMAEIDRIVAACVVNPVGPEFMAPSTQRRAVV